MNVKPKPAPRQCVKCGVHAPTPLTHGWKVEPKLVDTRTWNRKRAAPEMELVCAECWTQYLVAGSAPWV